MRPRRVETAVGTSDGVGDGDGEGDIERRDCVGLYGSVSIVCVRDEMESQVEREEWRLTRTGPDFIHAADWASRRTDGWPT